MPTYPPWIRVKYTFMALIVALKHEHRVVTLDYFETALVELAWWLSSLRLPTGKLGNSTAKEIW
jgi:hypothetical protein